MHSRLRALWVAVLLGAAIATPAWCGGYQAGVKITRIYTNTTTGVIIFQTSGSSTGAPACMNSQWPFAYQGSTSNQVAAATTALLISAMTTGTTVRLDGAGTCNVSSGSEDLIDVYYNN